MRLGPAPARPLAKAPKLCAQNNGLPPHRWSCFDPFRSPRFRRPLHAATRATVSPQTPAPPFRSNRRPIALGRPASRFPAATRAAAKVVCVSEHRCNVVPVAACGSVNGEEMPLHALAPSAADQRRIVTAEPDRTYSRLLYRLRRDSEAVQHVWKVRMHEVALKHASCLLDHSTGGRVVHQREGDKIV